MNIVDTIRILNEEKGSFLKTTIQYIQFEMSGILKDVAHIHLVSAEQAFISATTSNNPEVESRIGIGHLRDSFNAFQMYLEKGDKWFGGLFYTRWQPEEMTSIQLKLSSIALVIALIYKKLDDQSNYITWKNTGVRIGLPFVQERAFAIKGWKEAEKSNNDQGWNGRQPTYSPDLKKRQAYKDELVFIELFASAIKEV